MTTPTEPLGATPSTLIRRGRLMEFLRRIQTEDGWYQGQAYWIAAASKLYEGHGTTDRCFDDLKALHRKGLVVREGRPAKWRVA